MTAGFRGELIRSIKTRLKTELAVEPAIPLEIKLRLERLRLAELRHAGASQGVDGGEPEVPRAHGTLAPASA
jgi:hypothetical protein